MTERGLSAAAGPEAGLVIQFHGPADFAALQAQCNLAPVSHAGAYFIDISSTAASQAQNHTAHLFFADDDGAFYALKTLRQLLSHGTIRSTAIYDFPTSPLRGVLEGFYGTPWSREDRLGMMRELANLKFNLFVYGPKMDGYINVGWTLPYPTSELNYISKLMEEANQQHLQVCWEIHAGWPINFSSEKDMELILSKFADVAERGVTCFLIAFDDVGKTLTAKDAEVYATYVEGISDFVTRLGDNLKASYPQAMLAFVPHEYYTHDAGISDLVQVLKQIQEYWFVAWTGPEVVSVTITGADLDEITQLLGRAPMLGDNYPVNDPFAMFKGEQYLHLAPITGRDKTLAQTAPALVFNASASAWASLPPLATISDYIWNADMYAADRSAASTALYFAGSQGQAALELLMQTNYSPLLMPNAAPGLADAMGLFWQAWDGTDAQALATSAAALQDLYFTPFGDMESALTGAPDMHPQLMAQILPHVQATAQLGTHCTTLVDLLLDKHMGIAPDAAIVAELATALEQLSAPETPRPTGYLTLDFMAKSIALLTDQPLPEPHMD